LKKASFFVRVCNHPLRKEFEGDKPIQRRVLSLVDDTHSAFANLFKHFVPGDDLSYHGLLVLSALEDRPFNMEDLGIAVNRKPEGRFDFPEL
jgi:hypothetical protein